MEVFQLCQRNFLIITLLVVLTFSRRSLCVRNLVDLRTTDNHVFHRIRNLRGIPYGLDASVEENNIEAGLVPQILAVKLEPSKDEPNIGESWNITCMAEVRHDTVNKSNLNLFWRSEDRTLLMSNEKTKMNEFRSMVTGESIFAETYVRVPRLLHSHGGIYECVAQYMDLEQTATYKLRLKYDNILDFDCMHRSDCPESMDCNLNRCVCDTNHPILITSLTSKSDRLCYPVAELGYFCHESSQCEKSTINSVCLKNICQCQKGYTMTAKIMQSGSTQFSCELQENIANDKQSAYRGIMIASACFGVIFLLVVAAFPVRRSCGGKCSFLRRRYDVDRSGRRIERRRPRSLTSIVSQISLSSQDAEKPPSYDEVVGSGSAYEDAPPSYDSLGVRWSSERNEEVNIPSPIPLDLTLSPGSDEDQPRLAMSSSSGWTVIPLNDTDATLDDNSRTPSSLTDPPLHSTPVATEAAPSVNIKIQ